MMKERMKRRVMAMMLLCGLCCTELFAFGNDQSAQAQSWGYQPVYHANVSAPAYQFRTTSVYINTSGDTDPGAMMGAYYGPRKTSPFDWSEEDNALGEVPDQPIGDTPWWFMLLLAAGYIAFRLFRRRKA